MLLWKEAYGNSIDSHIKGSSAKFFPLILRVSLMKREGKEKD